MHDPMHDPMAHGLPHREPFVFIDSVIDVVPGERAVCVKTFAAAEPFFRGHFPGDPIVPGVILAEALAQTAGIAAGRADSAKSYRLSAIKLMKFFKPARPLDEITLRAEKSAAVGGLLQFSVSALVLGEPVAEGAIVLSEA
jgi:3-hydroxyacyl-[acyl-carrier-protein] dehydratase